jgi:hypothetical protein
MVITRCLTIALITLPVAIGSHSRVTATGLSRVRRWSTPPISEDRDLTAAAVW